MRESGKEGLGSDAKRHPERSREISLYAKIILWTEND